MAQPNLEQLSRTALEHHRAGRLSAAKAIYQQILAAQPNNADATCLLGIIARQEGRPDEAVQFIQRAIAINPTKAEAYHSLGDAHRNRGKLDEAAAAYAQAVQLKPSWAEAHTALGDIYLDQAKFDQATAEYNAALHLKPTLLLAHLNLGRVLHAQAKYPEAIAVFRKSIQSNGNWPEAHECLGNALAASGNFDEAIGVFTKAIQLKPALFTADWSLGKIFVSQGRQQEATACFHHAAQLNPTNAYARFYLACRFAKAGRNEEAATEFREAIRLKPDSPGWKYQLAAVSGDRSIKTTPAQYIRELFDFYAPRFDSHLVEKLKYQIPKLLQQHVLEATHRNDLEILDLGSGTGLCGLEFRPQARRLVGVDLSPEMNKIAASRKIYDELITGDLMLALRAPGAAYDLIVAAEVLLYVGDITEFLPAVAAALKPGGIFACSIEDYEGSGYFLNTDERFTHSITYMREMAATCGLQEISANKVSLRHGKGADIFGWIVLLGKK